MIPCLFCGGDRSAPDHAQQCDGRQGKVEAAAQDDPQVVLGPHFNGPDYDPDLDHARLTGQIARIFTLMGDHAWRTLGEIEAETGDPQASISAQLRHLRKRRFGAFVIEKRRRGADDTGLFEYRLLPPVEMEQSA